MSAAKTYSRAKTDSPATHNLRCPLGAAMFSEPAWQEIARSLRLSGRELQILHDVFDDHTEFTIANNLRISPHTVHTHCERLYRKLAVSDRVKLVLRVMDEFLTLTVAPGSVLPPICANRTVGRCPLRNPKGSGPITSRSPARISKKQGFQQGACRLNSRLPQVVPFV